MATGGRAAQRSRLETPSTSGGIQHSLTLKGRSNAAIYVRPAVRCQQTDPPFLSARRSMNSGRHVMLSRIFPNDGRDVKPNQTRNTKSIPRDEDRILDLAESPLLRLFLHACPNTAAESTRCQPLKTQKSPFLSVRGRGCTRPRPAGRGDCLAQPADDRGALR